MADLTGKVALITGAGSGIGRAAAVRFTAAAVERSPMRASHLHFMVSAPGLRTLVTHIFVRGDELLGSDAVFGVKESLVKDFVSHPSGAPAPDGRDLGGRGWASVCFDIVLAPAEPEN